MTQWIEVAPNMWASKPEPKPKSPAAAALEAALTPPEEPVKGDANHKIQEAGVAPSTGLASASDKEEARQHAGPYEQTKEHFHEQKIEFEHADLQKELEVNPVVGRNGYIDQ